MSAYDIRLEDPDLLGEQRRGVQERLYNLSWH